MIFDHRPIGDEIEMSRNWIDKRKGRIPPAGRK